MRLKSIRLAGFKSFVDPTKVPLPSNLIAVVGPNGCGKSNIIDAIRWVMGESSAKNLRGDSMTDVIFNGSSVRKPVGQAQVELIFDNSDATLGGEYAKYSEISIKRVVSREGQSSYFLNSSRCRRRDITDIFHGTGLGARSYSIIAQDTISRLIEAKPEELRVYLEDAAGISKYKERRRETETRIRHTRENLERLTDIRDELQKHLERLDRQAKAAAKYQAFRQQERQYKAQLLALKWQHLHGKLETQTSEITQLDLKQAALNTDLAQNTRQHTQQREALQELNETFESTQTHFYQLGSEIARLEEAIQHQQSRRQQLQNDAQQVDEQLQTLLQHAKADQQQLEQLQTEAGSLQPELEQAQQTLAEQEKELEAKEATYQTWQNEWESFNKLSAQTNNIIEVQTAKLNQYQQSLVRLQEREARLLTEKDAQNDDGVQSKLAELNQELSSAKVTHDAYLANLTEQQQQLVKQRQHRQGLYQTLDKARSVHQEALGRRASLVALQQSALGKGETAVNDWLEQQHLASATRFAECISVTPGWEAAVETALGHLLQAVCVDDLSQLQAPLHQLPSFNLTFLQPTQEAVVAEPQLRSITEVVTTEARFDVMLQHIFICDDVDQAFALRPKLKPHHVLISRDGLLFTPYSLAFCQEQDAKAGVIKRQQELSELELTLSEQAKRIEQYETQLAEAQGAVQALESDIAQSQQRIGQSTQHQADLNGKIHMARSEIQKVQDRCQQIETELSDISNQKETLSKESALAESTLTASRAKMEAFADEQTTRLTQKQSLLDALANLRQTIQHQRQQAQQLLLRWQTATTQQSALNERIQRQNASVQQLEKQQEGINLALASATNPDSLSQQLKTKLVSHNELEQELQQHRQRRDHAEQQLQALEKSKSATEESVRDLVSRMNQLKMDAEGLRVRATTYEEQLEETGHTMTAVIEALPADANEAEWEAECNKLAQKIQRLGAINLAAIDEFETESERKQHLDTQHADLVEALTLLENAIQKIDRETRSRFKDTFNTVNDTFKKLFPRLFGGGSAYLELIGDDVLDCGVGVMARPPGKRNSSIHLLSGGEKAMTAVSLVFSIFKLNPSPFCLLDEVDAPLDDANVGRFTKMVKEMSQNTQFLIITHNKVTMELAEHLTGVTMHEPGVSRLVAVDVEEAISLADA